MPGLAFPDFLKRYQLQLLAVSTDDVSPGAVVDRARKGYLPQGHLREVLASEPPTFWDTELNAANIVYGSVERELKLGGKASLSEMGVDISGGLRRAKSATFSITGILARTFRNGPGCASLFSLTPKVFALRKSDKPRWRLVNGKWIVLETYYAAEVTVAFEVDGNVDVKADIAAEGGLNVSGGAEIAWKNKRSFTVTKNTNVPFAFRGWRV